MGSTGADSTGPLAISRTFTRSIAHLHSGSRVKLIVTQNFNHEHPFGLASVKLLSTTPQPTGSSADTPTSSVRAQGAKRQLEPAEFELGSTGSAGGPVHTALLPGSWAPVLSIEPTSKSTYKGPRYRAPGDTRVECSMEAKGQICRNNTPLHCATFWHTRPAGSAPPARSAGPVRGTVSTGDDSAGIPPVPVAKPWWSADLEVGSATIVAITLSSLRGRGVYRSLCCHPVN